MLKFTKWYKYEHKHSGINFVTPYQKHTGQEKEILTKRNQVYNLARDKNPLRWSANIRLGCY